jgi:hypothetical protein
MRQPPVIVPDLRRLFLAIAHTTLASSWLAACVEEPAVDSPASPRDRAEGGNQVVGGDPATTSQSAPVAGGGPTASSPNSQLPVPTPSIHPDASVPPSDAAVKPETDGGGSDGGSLNGDGGSTSAWERVPCPASTALPEASLQTPNAISHVGIYAQFDTPHSIALPDGGRPPPTIAETARSGAACADMASSSACQQQVKTLADQLCAQLPCQIAIVSEAGMHSRMDTRAELLRRFGDIDSAAEVVLLAAFDGHKVCPGMRSDPLAIGGEVRSTPAGFELRTTWEECGQPLQRALLSVDAAGKLVLVSKEILRPGNCAIGRRPPGLCPERDGPARSETGAYLARVAQLEHASIYAFYQLIQELRAHQAPEELRLMALDAMLDEVRHARDMRTLARDFGAETVWAQVKQTALRSLLEIAIDNAREGCVRETFGALLATYQAECAQDGRVQRAMAQIAEDETRHAMLSWKLKAWFSSLLSERERAQVSEAEAQAQAELASELEVELPESLRRALGLPSADVAAVLFKRLSRALPN